MASKNRLKMKQLDRAKQFAPFAALKGFEEALRAKEKVVLAKRDLSEEEMDALNNAINTVCFGDMVIARFYQGDECIELQGVVSRIDIDAKIIKIINTKIMFEDLYYLEVLKR